MTLATKRLLVGRTIVDVDLRAWDDTNDSGRKLGKKYDPVITLDNGARLTFTVQELDSGDGYAVKPDYHPRKGG